MKGLVVFDSYYGNTKQVAEVIGEQIRSEGHEAVVASARDGQPWELEADFLFVGSPTRIGRPSRKVRKFIKKLDAQLWSPKPVAAFDTYMIPDSKDQRSLKYTEYGAAYFIHDMLKERGLKVRTTPLKCVVTGSEGPLADGALDNARRYTHEFLMALR